MKFTLAITAVLACLFALKGVRADDYDHHGRGYYGHKGGYVDSYTSYVPYAQPVPIAAGTFGGVAGAGLGGGLGGGLFGGDGAGILIFFLLLLALSNNNNGNGIFG